ncbi:chorismate--pyruvate lyase family protein [Legionella jamestowniensis]|uniref:4-hydroxybenzoate synthetase n=1 Tax=Legionella jamestowniensis TaxID=455 RepID=A0A0W0UU69_9GAMM|nr:chorismate lyase [Legionella jamestowniensis]KTD11418.1 4-hydroxybenzoate synthetase [Legionella jamestowniensis]SFL67592.1 chorismate lyase [Legionella jamestowniensis DSM 19215]
MPDQTVNPPERLLPWLTHQLSLTDKLKKERGEAVLSILKQEWKDCSWWDKYVLGLNINPVMHREIIMTSQNNACWYARTIIPHDCYEVNTSLFIRLKEESLGVIIFDTPEIQRERIVHYSIDSTSLEYYWLPHHLRERHSLWVRLSKFALPQSTFFYLVEILLPELLRIKK